MHTLLSRVLLRAFVFAAPATALSAQLEIHGSDELAELARHTKTVLREQRATNSTDLWHMMVAHLRLGQLVQARTLLTQHQGSEQPELILAAFATLRRTTGEHLLTSARRRTLEQALSKSEQEPFACFRDAALQIHGRYCLALLDDGAQRSQHERIATLRLLALESEAWQPGRGHYRPTPCRGRLLGPAPADASLLQPQSFGMLLASGDRLTQHLTNTLVAARSNSKLRWQSMLPPTDTAALLLTAAAQIGDHDATSQAFAIVIKQRAQTPGKAARDLNAALQAITGVRLAAGAGLSPSWLRMAPWLPDHVDALELRGIHALKHQLTVSLERHKASQNLRVVASLQHGKSAKLPLVISNRWQQFVTEIGSNQPFECELRGAKLAPRKTLPTNPETDHDALRRLDPRCR